MVLTGIGVGFIGGALGGALSIFVMLTVATSVIGGIMTPGDYYALIGLAGAIGGSGVALGMVWIGVQSEVAAVRRVFFFLDMEVEPPARTRERLAVRDGVSFENVGLRYPNGHRALSNINLSLNLGELVAFVGPTGAGKTSLAYLIPGFYRPTEGRVRLDGRDIAEVDLDSLRSQVSYVFQEHLLLNESIRGNLKLANPSATEADIRRACDAASATEFIERLPDGLDTRLGQSGDTLSVGQKQRVCIARGLVRDTRILILDEPTAALDPQTENALVNALRQAAEGRLVIVIAHRLSTIRQADRIVFLEDGTIREVGTHDGMMAVPDGAYRRFVELQGGDVGTV